MKYENLHPKAKGQIVESRFIFECALRDIQVCQPIGENTRYDFIIDVNDELLKIQCKALRKENISSGVRYVLPVRSTGQNKIPKSYHGEIDYFFGYNAEDNIIVFVPIEDCGNNSLSFIKKDSVDKPIKTQRLVENFQFKLT